MTVRSTFASFLAYRTDCSRSGPGFCLDRDQFPDSHQVVSGRLEDEDPINPLGSNDIYRPKKDTPPSKIIETIRALIAGGADIEAKYNYNQTALQCAARDGHVEIVEILLELGAKID